MSRRALLSSTIGLALVTSAGLVGVAGARADAPSSGTGLLSWPVVDGTYRITFNPPPGLTWEDLNAGDQMWATLADYPELGTVTVLDADGNPVRGLTRACMTEAWWENPQWPQGDQACVSVTEQAPGVYLFPTVAMITVAEGTPADMESFQVTARINSSTLETVLECRHAVTARPSGVTSGQDGPGIPVRVHMTTRSPIDYGRTACQGPGRLDEYQFASAYLGPGLGMVPGTFVNLGYGTYSFSVYAQRPGDYTIDLGPGLGVGSHSVTLNFVDFTMWDTLQTLIQIVLRSLLPLLTHVMSWLPRLG